MKVKTYGINGLTEWHGKLKAGSIETRVSFVGGTASPSGAQPAYMTTKDPITQFVVENSAEYKSGFITLLLTQEVSGVHPRMAVPKQGIAEERSGQVEEQMTNDVGQEETAKEVEVPDKREAIEWLKEHYPDKGYTAVKLRSEAAFEEACREAGVTFKMTE